ncbi:hypothetical protein GQ44DRAFT_720642 [Phaeosphaeriaceae sp. PMI808]|nr:hypothetical protein GQ44DRAFT_720642 [Phaeosphaeriaceae sp. PMI808]
MATVRCDMSSGPLWVPMNPSRTGAHSLDTFNSQHSYNLSPPEPDTMQQIGGLCYGCGGQGCITCTNTVVDSMYADEHSPGLSHRSHYTQIYGHALQNILNDGMLYSEPENSESHPEFSHDHSTPYMSTYPPLDISMANCMPVHAISAPNNSENASRKSSRDHSASSPRRNTERANINNCRPEPQIRAQSTSNQFKCTFKCGTVFSNSRNRDRHEAHHCKNLRKRVQNPMVCPECCRRFTRNDNLTKHMANVHRRCSKCKAEFRDSADIAEHKQEKHNIPKRTQMRDAKFTFEEGNSAKLYESEDDAYGWCIEW